MNAQNHIRRRRSQAAQRGFVLVTGMLFLVVLTLLGLAMFRGTGLMDRISANTRDKQRAFEAAESALQYAEWWLGNGGGGQGSTCSGMGKVSGMTKANVHTCSNPLPAAYTATVPFSDAFTYTPPGIQATGGGGMSSTNASDVNYAFLPGFYIEYLGLNANGTKQYYQVTAYGTGGNSDTASVVRSTYAVTTSVKSLDGL